MAGTFAGPAYGTPIFVAQNISSTAALISGITALVLDQNKINQAWITVALNDIRYRWDGVSPTTAQGHVLSPGTPLRLSGKRTILNFRFIGAAGAAAVVSMTLDDRANAGGTI